MASVQGKTAIVTGAGSGIGRAIALSFSEAGVQVGLVGRRKAPLEQLAEELKGSGGEPLVSSADVADRSSVQSAVTRLVSHMGRTDILVNNAGINTARRGLRDISDEDWDRVVATNLTGAFNVFRAVRPHMEKEGEGLVINIASMAGKRAGVVGGAAYSASKFGMASLTQSINAEFRDFGIRACCIYPGEVDTPILDYRPVAVTAERRAAVLRPEDVAAVAVMVAGMPSRAIVEEVTVFPRAAGAG